MKKRYLIFGGILILHIIFVIISMNQPFHGDEVVFVESAKGIISQGKPIFDYSAFKPGMEGLWHIPTYIYLISLSISILGENIYAMRAISAIFNLFTVLMVYLITNQILSKSENRERLSLFATFLYALNPLTIQSSIAIDIDGGILNFSIYLFLYFFIKNKNWFYLLPSLVLVSISKEIGIIILFIVIFLTYILTLNFKKIPKLILLFILGSGISWGIWGLFSKILGLDFMAPIRHNFLNSSGGGWTLSRLITSLWAFKTFFYFGIPFIITLFLVFTIIFYYKILKNKKYIKDKVIQKIILLNIFAIATIFIYFYFSVSAWGFPKYQVVALPSMVIFIVFMLDRSNLVNYLKRTIQLKKIVFILLIILLLAYYFVVIQSPLLPEIDSTSGNSNVLSGVGFIFKSFLLYAIIPFFICFFVLSLTKTKGRIFVSLILLTLVAYLYLNSLHALVDYSTYIKYGDEGILETVSYINDRGIDYGEIATYIHIGTYLNMSEYYEITFVYDSKEKFKREILENPKINYIIIWKREMGRIGEENMNFFELEKKIGDYYIFRKL